MAQAVTIDTKTAREIVETLREIKRRVVRLEERFEAPPYGSKDWWEWSEKQADEDIKAGRVISFDSVEEAVKWLNS